MNTALSANIETVADALLAARRDHTLADATPAAALLRSADDAYAVQARVASALGWLSDGTPRAWKSGGPSRAATLTHAPLPPAGVWPSPARSGAWPLRLRGIEAEIALRLSVDVDAARAAAWREGDAARSIDAMVVSIEIVESRWREQLEAPALAKLADLQSHGALVLGAWVPFAARDWAAQVCRVRIGDRATVEYRGTHALGDPAFVLGPWLRHATRDGAVVRAGTVVTTGTWCGIVEAGAGDAVEVEFDGIGQARVTLDA